MNFKPPEEFFEVRVWPQDLQPPYRNDINKKKLFGNELAKGLAPLQAALTLFPNDTNAAMWVSQNWINDEVVLKIKNGEDKSLKILDKEQLASKVLEFADETDASGRFHVHEGKDRLAALKLYAEIQGFLKNENGGNTFNSNTFVGIRLVSPEEKQEETKIIDHVKEPDNVTKLPIRLVS